MATRHAERATRAAPSGHGPIARRGGRSGGVRAGADPRPRRRPGGDCRGAGAGRDRWRDHRQGTGAAGCRPGGDLGRALAARRPAEAAGTGASGRTGWPNPDHLGKAAYLARAEQAALDAGRANGVDPDRVRVSFPDADSFAAGAGRSDRAGPRRDGGSDGPRWKPRPWPKRRRRAAPPGRIGDGERRRLQRSARLSRRQRGCAPMSAAAYDRMAPRPPPTAGLTLIVVSGFRSDAEQAALFAAHPDPTWVAPPGRSLCTAARTELDLGPAAAYGWLAANATVSASSSATPGRPGTTVSRPARRPARPPATRRPGAGEGRRGRARCPPSSLRSTASRCCAPAGAGASRRPCSPLS